MEQNYVPMYVASKCGMTKYRKGPQRTAKEHYGLTCTKLAPIELNGPLYTSALQDFSHADGLS